VERPQFRLTKLADGGGLVLFKVPAAEG
jgi:hypothetical protein